VPDDASGWDYQLWVEFGSTRDSQEIAMVCGRGRIHLRGLSLHNFNPLAVRRRTIHFRQATPQGAGQAEQKSNPPVLSSITLRSSRDGVQFGAEATMKFPATVLLPLCLTLSAWSQVTEPPLGQDLKNLKEV